jgi:hypothetical protein
MRFARLLTFNVAVFSLAGCGTESDAELLKAACEARTCPDPAPEYLDCMPPGDPDWAFSCDEPCYSFFKDTCGIKYTL